jgi:hypothetical protein
MEIEGVLKAGLCPRTIMNQIIKDGQSQKTIYSYKYFEGAIPEEIMEKAK